MMPEYVPAVANHLWQSTLFVAVAGVLTLAFRRNSAALRHRIWLAASVKFLIPFSLFTTLGQRVSWRSLSQPVPAKVSIVLDQLSRPFSSMSNKPAMSPAAAPGSHAIVVSEVLGLIWLCGLSITGLKLLRFGRACRATP